MTDIFLGFLNRSLAAGILILAVVLVRLVFKKAPRWLLCALWALAAVRLVCPVSIESVLSLIPSAEPVQPEIIVSAQPAITSGIPARDSVTGPHSRGTIAPAALSLLSSHAIACTSGGSVTGTYRGGAVVSMLSRPTANSRSAAGSRSRSTASASTPASASSSSPSCRSRCR